MNFKAVFFDFDYTLADGTEAIVAGFRYAFGRMGLPEPTEEAIRPTIGMVLEDEFTFLSGEADPARRAEFRQLYTEKAGPMHVSVTRLFPGALELLTALKRRGIPTGIVSTKKTATIRDVAEARGITPLLSSILGGDQVSAPQAGPGGTPGLPHRPGAGTPRGSVLRRHRHRRGGRPAGWHSLLRGAQRHHHL